MMEVTSKLICCLGRSSITPEKLFPFEVDFFFVKIHLNYIICYVLSMRVSEIGRDW